MKRLIVLGLLVASLGVQIACSGDDKKQVIYVVPDSGPPTNNDFVCDPKDGTPQTQFTPVNVFQGRCTDDQIISLINDCAGGTSSEECTTTREKLGDCDKCLVGLPTDPDAHPFYQYDPNASLEVSIGACMLLFAQDDSQLKCAQAFGQMEICSFAACVPACLADENDKDYADHFDACLTAVEGANCTTGLTDYGGTECQALYKASTDATTKTYGFCTNRKAADGSDLSVGQYFFDVAVATCGVRDLDAGADAGKDAGKKEDAGEDAGDSGIQDAETDG